MPFFSNLNIWNPILFLQMEELLLLDFLKGSELLRTI